MTAFSRTTPTGVEWYCSDLDSLIGVSASAGDRGYIYTAGIWFLSNGTKWYPLDTARWGNNSSSAVPFGSLSADGVWTISAGAYTLGNADVNEDIDVLAIVFNATAGNISVALSGVTQIPAFLKIRCAHIERSDETGNSVTFSLSGGGMGGGAGSVGGGSNGTAAPTGFQCVGLGGGGGAGASNGGNGGAGVPLWGNASHGGAAGGGAAVGGAGTAGTSANPSPTDAWRDDHTATFLPIGSGGGGGGGDGANAGGAGGAGGGALIVQAAEIYATTGVDFDANGADGSASAGGNAAGGGGGGGGFCRVLYRVKTGSLGCSASGGSAGAGTGTGGAGGAGSNGIALTETS